MVCIKRYGAHPNASLPRTSRSRNKYLIQAEFRKQNITFMGAVRMQKYPSFWLRMHLKTKRLNTRFVQSDGEAARISSIDYISIKYVPSFRLADRRHSTILQTRLEDFQKIRYTFVDGPHTPSKFSLLLTN